jgi:hypothetical protein
MTRKPLETKTIVLPEIPWKMTKEEKRRHRDLVKRIGLTVRDSSLLHKRLQEHRESEWRDTVHAFEANPGSFYNAWHYLNNHPVFWTFGWVRDGRIPEVHERELQHEYGFPEGIEISVTRVDPKIRSISQDPALNTRLEVWYELSVTPWPTDEHYPTRIHAVQGDGGARTYEKAIIKAARKVHEMYGNDRRALEVDLAKWGGKNEPPKPELTTAGEWTGCQECYSFGCNMTVCNCTCHPIPVAAEALGCGGRPPLVKIPIETRKPGQWRFVDTETQQVWRWVDNGFKLVDPEADAESLALLADPEFLESMKQLRRGERVLAKTLQEEKEEKW